MTDIQIEELMSMVKVIYYSSAAVTGMVISIVLMIIHSKASER